MASPKNVTTTISTKGQVILPKTIRLQRDWPPGTRLIIEDHADGVFLKTAPAFVPTRPEDVFGVLGYQGTAKTLAEMEAGIAAEVKRRHARDRY